MALNNSTTVMRVQRGIAWLSVVLLSLKFWAWYITGSVALLTDTLESIVNVVTGFFGWYSVVLATRPRDTNHPYGHGKIEFLSAGVEGTLILIAGLLIIVEAIRKWIYPLPLGHLNTGIWITLITAAGNGLAGWYAMRIGKKNKSFTLEAAGNHLSVDAYSSIALVGGLLLLYFTGWLWLDSAVAIVFGLFIIRAGYGLLRRSVGGIMDEADLALVNKVIQLLAKNRQPDWVDMHNLRVIQYGNLLHLDAHLTLPWYYSVKQADFIVHEIERLIKEDCANQVEVFLHIDACAPFSCKICALQDCQVRQHPFQELVAWDMTNLWQDEKHNKMDA